VDVGHLRVWRLHQSADTGQFPVNDPANQILGHDLAPVNASQLFLTDKLLATPVSVSKAKTQYGSSSLELFEPTSSSRVPALSIP